tara:strand:- start:41323 stop:41586 length:264 start_codon:yes stop_codon:yes gene_type:complete
VFHFEINSELQIRCLIHCTLHFEAFIEILFRNSRSQAMSDRTACSRAAHFRGPLLESQLPGPDQLAASHEKKKPQHLLRLSGNDFVN